MTATLSPLRRAVAPVVSGRTWRTTLKIYFDLAWMLVAALAVLIPAAVALPLVVILPAGVALGAVAMVANRVCAALDRVALDLFLDLRLPSRHRPIPAVPAGGRWWSPLRGWRWFTSQLSDPALWRAIVYRLVSLPIALLAGVVATLVWCVPLTMLTAPVWVGVLPAGRWSFVPRPVLVAALMAGGLVLVTAAPVVIAAIGAVLRRVARRLLGDGRTADLEHRLEQVETSRTRVVDAAEAERRRIERDLHDGAQQRLVALAMNLGMAKERYATDPDAARQLIDEAHAEAKRALVELRDLARGLHPAVLTDRGLGPALSAVAARSAVPVTVDVSIPDRLDESAEGIAYFVVCESLANVAKHSDATQAHVAVARRGDRIVIEVGDDGRGGADAEGSGLAGLRDRVEGVDGWLHVASPVGGPTTITAEFPCAS